MTAARLDRSPSCGMSITLSQSQTTALETLVLLGRLFFGGTPKDQADRPLQLRLFPLLAGPTGVGKSYLVQQAAKALYADYFRLARGDWVVVGSRAGRPTTWQIIDRALERSMVVLHIDELDKCQIDFGAQEWSAALMTDLLGAIDLQLPYREYWAALEPEVKLKITPAKLAKRVRKNVWIVGSGTWQVVYDQARKKRMGFDRGSSNAVDTGSLAHAQLISPELLHRFNSDVLFLSYPSEHETQRLLEETGISGLARKLGMNVSPRDVDWSLGGVRVLESILTRLTVEASRRRSQVVPSPVSMPRDELPEIERQLES